MNEETIYPLADVTDTSGLRIEQEDDDPVLVSPDGRPVDTWRESYPYSERLSRLVYEQDKRLLQIELLKLQNWVKATGGRLVMLSSPCSRTAACLGERSRQP